MIVVKAESATSYMHQPKISFLVTGACGAASPVVDFGGGAAFIDVSEVIFYLTPSNRSTTSWSSFSYGSLFFANSARLRFIDLTCSARSLVNFRGTGSNDGSVEWISASSDWISLSSLNRRAFSLKIR